MTDLAHHIVDLMRSINGEYSQYSYESFFRAMDEKFPRVSHEVAATAQKILKDDYLAEPAGQANFLTVKRMLALCRHAIPYGIRVHTLDPESAPGEIAEIAPGPSSLIYVFESCSRKSPLSVAWATLFDVATAFHSNWGSVDDGLYICSDHANPQGTPEKLVGWVQLAYPEFARTVEEALCRGPYKT
jgi:hypothetical protein